MSPQEHNVMRLVEDSYWWFLALRQHVAETVAEHASVAPAILDAGCGSGGMLQALRRSFPDAKLSGVDASDHALALTAERQTGADLRSARVEKLPFADAQFDYVLSLDVLTHAEVDVLEALAEARRVLKPGGRIIVNVAAFAFLRGAHDVAVEVDHRYTSTALRQLMVTAGFAVERLSYWNTAMFPAVVAVRWLSRRASAGQARSDFRSLPRAANLALYRVALLELRAGARVSLPFGTSIFSVGRKHA